MDSCGHVYTSRVSNKDHTAAVTQRFFFMRRRGEISLVHRESNDHDLMTLIKDEEASRTVMPKFSLFIPLFFGGKSILKSFN